MRKKKIQRERMRITCIVSGSHVPRKHVHCESKKARRWASRSSRGSSVSFLEILILAHCCYGGAQCNTAKYAVLKRLS